MRIQQTGLLEWDKDRATPAFTLYTPSGEETTRLIDLSGEVRHSWKLPGRPGAYAYLLENGNLLAATNAQKAPAGLSAGGGLISEIDWDGNIVWQHADDLQHHDFKRLENGNTMYLAWERLTEEQQAKVKGGIPGTEHDGHIYGDVIKEITPDGEVVWEWHTATQLDYDEFPINPQCPRDEWAHANTCRPCADNGVIVNFRNNNLMGIIDKDTGKFRWTMCNWDFGQQHDVQMLENGNILFFGNGADLLRRGPEGGSNVTEIDPKTNEIVWQYRGNPPTSFLSWWISGCQRLWTGNTHITEGGYGRLFEVTPEGDIVWEFINPVFFEGPPQFGRQNRVFRSYRYAADGPELQGRAGEPQ